MFDNTSNKTILVLTANFGAGHISVATAVKEHILSIDSSYNIVIENFLQASIPKIDKPLIKLYETQTKYTPALYNYYYYIKKSHNPRYDITYKVYINKLVDYIKQLDPILIVSTFPVASECVFRFKNKQNNDIPLVTVITDVVDSMEWLFPRTDMYLVPSKEIKNRLIHKGIDHNTLKVTGIPVRKSFLFTESLEEDSNKNGILIMGGGRGAFDVDKDFVYWLDEFIEDNNYKSKVTIVTGRNEKTYKSLTNKKPLKNITVKGFVDDMASLMRSHNIIITKPGGATLFEAINCEIPVIARLPKVGQEIENAKFIIDKGIGIVYQDEFELQQHLINLIQGKLDNRIEFLKNNIVDFKNNITPYSVGEYILELIEK